MENLMEPCGGKMDGAKEPIGDSKGNIKEPSGYKMDDNKSKVFSTENVKSKSAPPDGALTGEKGPPGGSLEEIKHSSWYVIEGSNGEEEKVDKCTPTNEGIQTTSQERFSTCGQTEREDKGTERVVLRKAFMFGHQRVASSPPAITVSSVDLRR